MLRCSVALLGRWGHRDFMRGRTKRGGAVHTRHTHGSRGRYKRLSTLFGLRDGRRHTWNHMKGGLGVKLGGGLFGLRIPRQHALSTMTPEEYELNVYGHPSITNPYRDIMEEHPDLKGVMSNASLGVHVVLLMPRVPRTLQRATASIGSPDANQGVPPLWTALLRNLCEATRSDAAAPERGNHVTLHCATLSASISCQLPMSDALLSSSIAALYADHQRGAKKNSTATPVSSARRKRIPLLGPGMMAPQALQAAAGLAGTPRAVDKDSTVSSCGTVSQSGATELIRHLDQQHPNALRVCFRLSGRETNGSREPEKAPRKLLKEEMDPDETGVWNRPESTVGALMRWQYSNWDPRAHVSDSVPHGQRLQPVHVFVDASRLQEVVADKEIKRPKAATRSLMSSQFSEKLLAMNYQPVSHKSLAEIFEALNEWSMDYHWRSLGLKQHEKAEKRLHPANTIKGGKD